MTARAALWGRDHLEYGVIDEVEVAPGVALAISVGKVPKSYPFTDPNEDAVATVVDGDSVLLVVADGHSGKESTELAVASVLTYFADDDVARAWGLDQHVAIEVMGRAHRSVRTFTDRPGSHHPDTSTTLVVALCRGRRLQWAALGDSALFIASVTGARLLNSVRGDRFVGHWFMGTPEPWYDFDWGEFVLHDGEWVVAVTDGFLDYPRDMRPGKRLVACITDPPAPLLTARRVIETAFAGGAGDNIAVAVLAPPS